MNDVETLSSYVLLQLRLIRSAIFIFGLSEAQDRQLTLDMVDSMLLDLYDHGTLAPLDSYVHGYSDHHDTPQEAGDTTRRILELDPETLAGF